MTRIVLRSANQEDAYDLFEWRNAVETRRYSRDPSPIVWEHHARWFAQSLTRPDRYILIGEIASRPVGVLRFDQVTQTTVEVSVYLVPGHAGRGFGMALLDAGHAWVVAQLPDVVITRALVHPDNIASHKLFRKVGYSEIPGGYEYRFARNPS